MCRTFFSIFVLCTALWGQTGGDTGILIGVVGFPGAIQVQTGDPSGACDITQNPSLVYNSVGGGLWGCKSSVWTAISGGGGGGATSTSQLLDFAGVRTNSAMLTFGANCSPSAQCAVRFGNTVYPFTAPLIPVLSSGTGFAFVYISSAGVATVGYSGIALASCTNCTAVPASSFPITSIPLYTWHATSGSWDSTGTDYRSFLSGKPVVAGSGLTSTESGGTTTLSLNTTGVTAGSYTSVNATVDSFGRILSIANGGGGGGAGAANQLNDAAITRPFTTEIDLTYPGGGTNYGAAPFVTNYTTLVKAIITTASVCTTQYVYWDPVSNALKMDSNGTGSGQFALNSGTSTVITAITNYNATGYPQYSLPLYRIRAGCTTTGQWEPLVVTTGYWDDRSVYNRYVLKAASNGGLTMSYASGINQISIDQTQPIIAPYLQSLATNSDPGCTTTADFGKTWVDNTSGTTTSFKNCGAVAGSPAWVTTLGGGGGTVTSIGLVGTANQLTVTGTSPITTSGSWTLSLPSTLILPGSLQLNITGSTQCLNVNSLGVVSGTGAACGAGGGGVAIGGAVGGSPATGGILFTDGSSNLAQNAGLVYNTASRQLLLGTGSGDSTITVNTNWGLQIDSGGTASFRINPNGGAVYLHTTLSSGSMNIGASGGSGTTASTGSMFMRFQHLLFVNNTAGQGSDYTVGYDGISTSAIDTKFIVRQGQAQATSKLFDLQDNGGTSLVSFGPTGQLNMTNQTSFLFNGKTCSVSGASISCI